MGQILIRNLDDDVIARLKGRARTLEETLRRILAEAAKPSREEIIA